MNKKRRPRVARPIIKLLDDSKLITLKFTEEQFDLFFDMIDHVYDLDWDEFVKEANARRKASAERAGDTLEPERILTPEAFEKIFGSICDMQYKGRFGSDTAN